MLSWAQVFCTRARFATRRLDTQAHLAQRTERGGVLVLPPQHVLSLQVGVLAQCPIVELCSEGEECREGWGQSERH